MSNYRKQDLQRYAEIFKALSNPNRLNIFLQLVSCCCGPNSEMCDVSVKPETSASVGTLGKEVEIVPSTVSHHIKELFRAGLIRMERQGQQVQCWVDPSVLKELEEFFASS